MWTKSQFEFSRNLSFFPLSVSKDPRYAVFTKWRRKQVSWDEKERIVNQYVHSIDMVSDQRQGFIQSLHVQSPSFQIHVSDIIEYQKIWWDGFIIANIHVVSRNLYCDSGGQISPCWIPWWDSAFVLVWLTLITVNTRSTDLSIYGIFSAPRLTTN